MPKKHTPCLAQIGQKNNSGDGYADTFWSVCVWDGEYWWDKEGVGYPDRDHDVLKWYYIDDIERKMGATPDKDRPCLVQIKWESKTYPELNRNFWVVCVWDGERWLSGFNIDYSILDTLQWYYIDDIEQNLKGTNANA